MPAPHRPDLLDQFLAGYTARQEGVCIQVVENQGTVTVSTSALRVQMDMEAFKGFVRQAAAALRALERKRAHA